MIHGGSPLWCPEVEELGLIKKDFIHTENKVDTDLNRLKISNWLWNM